MALNSDILKRTKGHEIGQLGEDLAAMFLMKHGHKIVTRNYKKKVGEIDIVSRHDEIVHFVEVKAKEVKSLDDIDSGKFHEAEENVGYFKRRKLVRVINLYLAQYFSQKVPKYQFDVVAVYIDKNSRRARVRYLPDQILAN